MLRRFSLLSVPAMLSAFAVHSRAENPELNWQEVLKPLPQTSIVANAPRTSNVPFMLPDLYLSRPSNIAGPVSATAARFSGPELSALGGTTSNLIAAPSVVTRFDLGFTNTATTAPSLIGQPTTPSQSLSNNLLAAPPMLRDTGAGLGSASQFVLPAQFLNDSHPFPNR